MPFIRVLIVDNANAFNFSVRIESQSSFLCLNFFSERARCLDVAIMLEELQNLCRRVSVTRSPKLHID